MENSSTSTTFFLQANFIEASQIPTTMVIAAVPPDASGKFPHMYATMRPPMPSNSAGRAGEMFPEFVPPPPPMFEGQPLKPPVPPGKPDKSKTGKPPGKGEKKRESTV